MALKVKWRRELLPAEKRCDFKQLDEDWSSAETALVDELIPAMNQVIGRLEKDLRVILDAKTYGDLKDLKIGYKDKLVGIYKVHMFNAFKIGKLGVHKEFDIKKEFVFNAPAREFMDIKAEATVNNLLDKMKASALFTVLSGIKAGYTTDQIISSIKGPAFKQQQAEQLVAI